MKDAIAVNKEITVSLIWSQHHFPMVRYDGYPNCLFRGYYYLQLTYACDPEIYIAGTCSAWFCFLVEDIASLWWEILCLSEIIHYISKQWVTSIHVVTVFTHSISSWDGLTSWTDITCITCYWYCFTDFSTLTIKTYNAKQQVPLMNS